jgi:hypothetical protein
MMKLSRFLSSVVFLLGLSLALSLGLGGMSAHAQSNSKQATDAANKHRLEKSAPNNAPSKPMAKSASVAKQLETCKANASWNVVKREQCVWNLCKGRWGKDGCPQEASSKPAAS